MAVKIIQQLVDDIDGTVLEPGEGETVRFSLDNTSYEIDLSAANATALRDALSSYVSAARRAPGARAAAGRPRAASGRRNDLTAVREWAKANGYAVSTRGRVSREILDAYEAAH